MSTLKKLKNVLMYSYIIIPMNAKTNLTKEMFSWVLQCYKIVHLARTKNFP